MFTCQSNNVSHVKINDLYSILSCIRFFVQFSLNFYFFNEVILFSFKLRTNLLFILKFIVLLNFLFSFKIRKKFLRIKTNFKILDQ